MPRSKNPQAHSNPGPKLGGEFAPVFGTDFPVQLTTLIGRGQDVAAALEMMVAPKCAC